jgi:hypothetical protein
MPVVLLKYTVIKCCNIIYKTVIKYNIGIKFQYLSSRHLLLYLVDNHTTVCWIQN